MSVPEKEMMLPPSKTCAGMNPTEVIRNMKYLFSLNGKSIEICVTPGCLASDIRMLRPEKIQRIA